MNYSRSILFGVIPFYHTGLMGTYAILRAPWACRHISAMATASMQPRLKDKDYGAQVTYTGVKNLSLIFNYYEEDFPRSLLEPTRV